MQTSWFSTLFMVATLPCGLTEIFENITDHGKDGLIIATKDMVTDSYVSEVDENIVKDSFDNKTDADRLIINQNHRGRLNDTMVQFGDTLEYQISTEKYKVEKEERSGITFQPSYFQSQVEEFVFSPWYFLVFSPVNKSSSLPAVISSISSEILESLSSKLSVPPSVFFITSIVKYTSSDTFLSVNLSLVTPLIHNLHQELCTLHKKTPFFMIGGTMVELYQVRHQNNQHIYVTRNKVESGENMQSLWSYKRCKPRLLKVQLQLN